MTETLTEWCQECDTEVELKNPKKQTWQPCPACGELILPCGLCYNEKTQNQDCEHCWDTWNKRPEKLEERQKKRS